MNRQLTCDAHRLPHALYRASQVRELDRIAIERHAQPGLDLMERAGGATYRLLRERWPDRQQILVLCGVGNNGGDGYVVARLALADSIKVRVLELDEPDRLSADARTMRERFLVAGGTPEPFGALPPGAWVIVDALLGTGLARPVEGRWAAAIRAANEHSAPIIAIDIPSGLHADTGAILNEAIRADATMTFVGLKQGMFTADGPDCCGEIHFASLELPAQVYASQILSARRLDWDKQVALLGRRRRNAHKGDFGHVLVIGGAPGYLGAPRLAAEGVLRAGAGLVTVATHPQHAPYLNLTRPEIMCHALAGPDALAALIERATVIAIGPGLGQNDWGQILLQRVLTAQRPLVVDADALNLIARSPVARNDWVLTPHPGEASRLLATNTAEVQSDRFAALGRLRERYGGTIVLKGAGTLIAGESHRPPAVCAAGNPGMATGGTGDVLTGMIAAFVAQGMTPEDAAECGVCLHAAAGDAAAAMGERGLLASDLLDAIRPLLNGISVCAS